jgi:hypothetical protein
MKTNSIDTNHSLPPLPPELRFLIACCQTTPSKDDTHFIQNLLSEIDYQQLIDIASRHGVLPLVYNTLKGLSQGDKGSIQDFLSELKPINMSIAQRNMLMCSELIKIMRLLEENHIEALAFKGPALAQTAYGDITLRQFGDLDILIREKDRSRVIDLLAREHYTHEIDLTDINESFFKCVSVVGLYKESTGVLVEIHWELLSRNYAIDWEEKSLWGKPESVWINHKEIPILPLEQQLLYLCAHGSKHLFERLEWVCDIDRSIRANPDIDWQHLLNEAEKLGIKRMLYLGLTLSRQFFGLELPEMILQKTEQDKALPKLISKIMESSFSKNSQEGKSYSYFGLIRNMRENPGDQLRFAWQGLFAPQFDDFKFVELPKNLSFLYPIVRPYRLVTKYFR